MSMDMSQHAVVSLVKKSIECRHKTVDTNCIDNVSYMYAIRQLIVYKGSVSAFW